MKSIVLSGRLTKDPDVKVIENKDTKVANLRLANNDNEKEENEFYDVHCWGNLADIAEKYLKKGSKIVVLGTFCNESYTDAENKKRIKLSITATKFDFCDSKEKV